MDHLLYGKIRNDIVELLQAAVSGAQLVTRFQSAA
jgi:hypothetical protein